MTAKDTPSCRTAPARVRLTLSRIEKLTLPPGKQEAILWDTERPYLGVRLRSRKKTFIYYRKVGSRPLRLSLGSVDSLTIEQARKEAERISGLIAQGIDPREDKRRRQEEAEAAQRERVRARVTFGDLWAAYIEDNASGWSDHHVSDHRKVMAPPGMPRKRSNKKTVAGVLWPLREVLLVDLSPDMLQAHMAKEAARRPTTTAKAWRLLRACLRWGATRPEYAGLYDTQALVAAAGKKVRKSSQVKDDVLQREQLAAWFQAVQQLSEPAHRVYLQALLLTGARSAELLRLQWRDVDFQWSTLTIGDKVEGRRMIPLTPYVRQLLQSLPRRDKYVFTTARTRSGEHMARCNRQHNQVVAAAGLPHVTLHGLRRSFGSLSEWVEVPAGIVAQIMGHKPKATAERHYRVRPVELLRQWHTRIEAWMLEQAGIKQPAEDLRQLRVVR